MNALIVEPKLIGSVIFVAMTLLLKWLISRHLSRLPEDEDELPKRWINSVKNISHLVIATGLVMIWLTELRYVALSIAAFAVALVVATREFIQCILGGLFHAGTGAFSVGDWITIGGDTGQVVRSDWLSTTLLEIDMTSPSYAYTGRSVVIPNSQFVTSPVVNLNFMRRYVAHSFAIVRECEPGIDVSEAAALLLERASAHCLPFIEVASRYGQLIEKRLGIKGIEPRPAVRVGTNSAGKLTFTATIFCPTREAVNIEQKITLDFLVFWQAAGRLPLRVRGAANEQNVEPGGAEDHPAFMHRPFPRFG